MKALKNENKMRVSLNCKTIQLIQQCMECMEFGRSWMEDKSCESPPRCPMIAMLMEFAPEFLCQY